MNLKCKYSMYLILLILLLITTSVNIYLNAKNNIGGENLVNLNKTGQKMIRVKGVFDGKGKTYMGYYPRSSGEYRTPVFILEKGATLKNVIIKKSIIEAFEVMGNNVIENVVIKDCGSHAIDMPRKAYGGTITIRNCTFDSVSGYLVHTSKSSTWNIINCTVNRANKVFRQRASWTFPVTVNIINLKTTDIKDSIARSESPFCKINYRNISSNLPKDKWWQGQLEVIDIGAFIKKKDKYKTKKF